MGHARQIKKEDGGIGERGSRSKQRSAGCRWHRAGELEKRFSGSWKEKVMGVGGGTGVLDRSKSGRDKVAGSDILSNGNDACFTFAFGGSWVRGCGFLSQVGHVSRMLMLHVKSCSRAFDLWSYDKNPLQVTTCKRGQRKNKLAPQNKQGATVARENFPVVEVKSRDRESERKGGRAWEEGRNTELKEGEKQIKEASSGRQARLSCTTKLKECRCKSIKINNSDKEI